METNKNLLFEMLELCEQIKELQSQLELKDYSWKDRLLASSCGKIYSRILLVEEEINNSLGHN